MHPTTGSARAAPARRSRRNIWIGLAALAAILIVNFWGVGAPPEPAATTAAAHLPQTGEASLRPAVDVARAAGSTERASALAPDVTQSPEPSSLGAAPSARTSAASPAVRAADGGPRLGVEGSAAIPASIVERPRPPKRGRPLLIAEPRPQPRATLVTEHRPRLVPSAELAPEPYLDDMGRMFPPEAPGEGTSKRATAPVLTGANEAPILD